MCGGVRCGSGYIALQCHPARSSSACQSRRWAAAPQAFSRPWRWLSVVALGGQPSCSSRRAYGLAVEQGSHVKGQGGLLGAVDLHASGGNDGRWGGCGGSCGGGAGDGVRCGGGLRARPRRSCGAASVERRVRCSWVLYPWGCLGGAPSIEVAPQDESALVCTATLRLVRFARRCAYGASVVPSPGEDSGDRGWQEGTLSTRQRAGRTGARASSSHCAVVATGGSAAGSGGRHGTAMVVGQWRVLPPARGHAHFGRAHTGWCCRFVGSPAL